MAGDPGITRWRQTWAQLRASDADEALFHELAARYSEPHRRYPTRQHLAECFGKLKALEADAEHPGEVELALWFHDAIYDVSRHDNEQRSAEWARSAMIAAVLADSSAGSVPCMCP